MVVDWMLIHPTEEKHLIVKSDEPKDDETKTVQKEVHFLFNHFF